MFPQLAEARAAVVGLRALAAAGTLPPPLDDSPKCPRCALVGICLPDETALLRGGAPVLRPIAEVMVETTEEAVAPSLQACARLRAAGARSVALYAARSDELDPRFIGERARARGCQLCYPRVATSSPPTLTFHACDETELAPGGFGVREPSAAAPQPTITVATTTGGVSGDICNCGFGNPACAPTFQALFDALAQLLDDLRGQRLLALQSGKRNCHAEITHTVSMQ